MKKKATKTTNGTAEVDGYVVKQKMHEISHLVETKQLEPLQCNAIVAAYKTLLLVEKERRQTLQWARKRPPADIIRFAESRKR